MNTMNSLPPRLFNSKNSAIFTFNLIVLITVSYFAFSKNQAFFLFGWDGSYMLDLIKQQFKWGISSYFGLTNNLFQSMGNVYFPLNANLTPAFLFSSLFSDISASKTIWYIIFPLEIFCILYLFSVNFRFKAYTALLASWIFVLSFFSYLGSSKIYGIFGLTPQLCSAIAEVYFFIIVTSFFTKKNQPWYSKLIILLLAFLIPLHISIAYSGAIMMSMPLFGLFILCWTATIAKDHRTFFISAILVLTLTLTALGFFHYYFGLFGYTAARFFPNELLNTRSTWYNVSIAFHSNMHDFSGSLLFILAIMGSIMDVFRQNGIRKNLAIMFLVYVSLILLFGIIIIYCYQEWQGPVPLYFETFVWPLYALYAAVLLNTIGQLLSFIFRKIKYFSRFTHFNLGILLPLVIAAFFLIRLPSLPLTTASIIYPPSHTPITEILVKEIALNPASAFRGRVANLTGQGPEKINWFDLHTLDHTQIQSFGNDHRLMGLNYYDIPSFFEYSPFITPAFYLFTKKLLAYPNDVQVRNVMVLRNADPKILKLLGVRFFITDAPINTQATLRTELKNPALYLYELTDVNLGQYSPVHTILITNAKSTLDKIAETAFNPKHSVVIHKEVPELRNLVPASHTKMIVKKNGKLKISSRSTGSSLIVLPLEYSHCLKLNSQSTESALPKLLRVNLLQTGILFQGELEANLKYFTGPFHNSRCRIADIADGKELKFQEVN